MRIPSRSRLAGQCPHASVPDLSGLAGIMNGVDDEIIRLITEHTAGLVGAIVPDGEGACLGTSAVLARVLVDQGEPVTLVRGTYDEHAHWWLLTARLRLDATRRQFSLTEPFVEVLAADAARDEIPYVVEETFPARWTHEEAAIEFARMFTYHDVGLQHGRRLLRSLGNFAARTWLPAVPATAGQG